MTASRSGWWQFALVSAFFFQITAATFTSLGVVLPHMIAELNWSWADAGLGFSILALLVGIASRVPGWTLSRYGARATFVAGGLIMTLGHGLAATATGLMQYYLATAALGFGYTLCALIPGVPVISRALPAHRSFAIGAYMMIGGLGGVAGPLLVTASVSLGDSWRLHWWILAASVLALAVIALFVLDDQKHSGEDTDEVSSTSEKHAASVYVTTHQWAFRDVIRTPQFLIIVAAQSLTLLTGLTTNTWAASHMGNLGVGAAIAAGALSAHALINALSRALGGWLATRIDPKWLLAAALAAEAIGMLALSVAESTPAIVLFALGEGFGFGMCMFATTMLLINYFGNREAARMIGTMYLVATVSMIGPSLSGFVADTTGSFAGVFQVYALIVTVAFFAVAFLKPPIADDRQAA